MLVVIGSYQISVQRREMNVQLQAQQEARRLRLEQQVEAERQHTLERLRETCGSIR